MNVSSFITDDGCAIAYDFCRDDNRPVLVLSASLGTAMALFDHQCAALGRHFSLLRYDPRGHGASDAPAGGYSLDRLGRDVVQLLDHLAIGQAHFLGVSLGGMTGQWLGYRAPERIGRLILANTSAYMGPPSGWAERIATVSSSGMTAMVEPVLERWFTSRFRQEEPSRVDAIRRLLSQTKPAGYAGCSAAIRDMDLRPVLPLIRIPTLVIAGAQDPATPLVHAELLAGQIANARLVAINAAHLSNVEHPDQFNAEVMRHLVEA